MERGLTQNVDDGPLSGTIDTAVDSLLRNIARVSALPEQPPRPRRGQIIDNKYRVEEPLGRGGMGLVFRASHVVSQKAVALKWMLRSTSDEQSRRRFLREALAAGRIDHPNVVDVYDVGEEGDCAYMVMELLHGETLQARLSRGPLEVREAIALLLPAMQGVCAVHGAGVIHRDLKPANIFLCTAPNGAAREAKVLDFGISTVLGGKSLASALTKDGMLLGTPAYMSPEQLECARDIDARADVYAFGVILYQALTGQLPFEADSYPSLVLAIMRQEPRPLHELRRDVPSELDAIVRRALAKQRNGRFSDVASLIDALRPFAVAREGSRPRPRARTWRHAALGVGCTIAIGWSAATALHAAGPAAAHPRAAQRARASSAPAPELAARAPTSVVEALNASAAGSTAASAVPPPVAPLATHAGKPRPSKRSLGWNPSKPTSERRDRAPAPEPHARSGTIRVEDLLIDP